MPRSRLQRLVERVHRAVAFARVDEQLAADPHLDDGIGDGDELALRVVAALDHDAEAFHVEELRHLAEGAAREQLEGGARGFIGVAQRFLRLHLVEQAGEARIVLVHLHADAGQLCQDVQRPAWFETSSLRALPTLSGGTCS